MTDIELLPLPEPMLVLGTRGKDAAEAWCRANVKLATAELHRQFGCELRDPNGTIWDHAANLQAEIEALRAEREVIGAEAVKYAGKSGRLEAKVDRLAEALQKLAAHVRPTCSVLWEEAQAALSGHDQESGNG